MSSSLGVPSTDSIKEDDMRRLFASAAVAGALLFGLGGVAVATPTGQIAHPGQHGQECGELPAVPGGGNSSQSPGSPFHDGVSGTKYAGEQAQNSGNGQASQYDVACFQVSSH
jgi:hypothetical protein